MDERLLIKQAKYLYPLKNCEITRVPEHEGGRNTVFIITSANGRKTVLRACELPDRTETDYLAETEFVHYLAINGAPVTDVIPSVNCRLVEQVEQEGQTVYLCMFEYAEGMLLSDNGYRYREGVPLEEYFFNTGKVLGMIHRLSKQYAPQYRRMEYKEKYNRSYINELIPDRYEILKAAIFRRFELFDRMPVDPETFGMVHFDFSDGNYHINMDDGRITVFDFDNCIKCWYMFDLANLWTHGEGWCRHITNADERMAYMKHYFDTVLSGYRTETDIPDELLDQLQLFIDMVLIENIVDEFECCARKGELPEDEDIHDAAECLIYCIPYAGITV